MGQYRQWLEYRDVDRQLHTYLKQLEDEFVQLQLRLDALMDANAPNDAINNNPIIQALALSMQPSIPMLRVMPEPYASTQNTSSGAYTFHPERMPIPQDMPNFQQEAVLGTLPQTPPWWSDTQPVMPAVEPIQGLVDQQSVRTNRLVQRWVARWGRHLSEIQTEAEEQP